MAALVILAVTTLPSIAAPAICAQLAPGSPAWNALCAPTPPAPVPSPPGRALVCEAGSARSLTFNGFCAGWAAYRRGSELVVICPGSPTPAGAAPLLCLGEAGACGR